ncbi:ribokinase [Mycolicibacterium sediminis]|uniref:Ribokinase n=1 Tax=Mycolicibacterium sediminis TaxID=1286180 RepID=A0A7I7QXY1_9MYCO|nr:ribokinase [Mycolicibacterium sediminis]
MCVVGSVNLDQSLRVRALPLPGETVLASSASWAPGGKGGNQSVAAARAGAAVDVVAAVGDDDAAARLRKHLTANGVGLDGVVTVPGPSGTAVIVVDDEAENSIVVAPGANAHLHLASARVEAIISAADVVLLQLEIPMDTVLAAARLGAASGAVVVLNASPSAAPEHLEALAATVDVVVVNEAESRDWHWPVDHLVITRGAEGVTHRGADGELTVAAPEVEAVDTTGAGDVFAGVLAADWHRGVEVALRRACAAGALATLVAGAGDCAPTREAIDDVLND